MALRNTDNHQSSQNGMNARTVRLQRFLARSGVASRRASEDLMTAGRVMVNGRVVRELGSKVVPGHDVVTVDGKEIEWGSEAVVLMLHKPCGILTTMDDPQGRPCVASLVPVAEHPGLYPVGRLDKDTSGLLVFTTDGNLGNALLHPSRHVDKTYRAVVEGMFLDSQAKRLSAGVMLDDGPTQPAIVDIVEASKQYSTVRITIHEGRKRQVRRMCDFVGHPVIELERISFGPLKLGDLEAGAWRMLGEGERQALYDVCRTVIE